MRARSRWQISPTPTASPSREGRTAIHLRRPEFGTLIGCAAVWPVAAFAQQQSEVVHIGFLGVAPAAAWASPVEALRAHLRDLG
jgi:hypothetical protein